ncbi:ABC transporter ATP-binding protein [Pseudooceanicola aestuarii]|uniref:ABC transporter ATP-binding protein n=1 Tax=Pseudooceanicola aestuarii TaxID=2697319 RepID=UPI0013D273D3|nr:ABC transporter ATP-binding protein [Pseudooceanicola aestuarii]
MSAFLEIENLNAFYGQVQALHGLSLSMERGTITTLLGANGAGKTTTLRAICNMIRTTGTISLDGQRISGRSTERIVEMGVAHVPQGRGTFTPLTVDENLRLGAMTRKDHRAIEEDIDKMFIRFPILKRRRSQQAGTLSGGEQQMLAVARALMLRPGLMLLDEPSFGLAPLVVQELFEILEQVNRDDGVSILVVEQNAQLALKIATKAYVIASGEIAMSGPADEIAQDDEVRKSYLGY